MSTPRKSEKVTHTPSKRVTRKSVSESGPTVGEAPTTAEDRFRQQPHDIEIGVGSDDFEIVLDDNARSNKKRKRSSGPISPPAIMDGQDLVKPFKLGWGRQLVIYGKPGSAPTKDTEVIYFSPGGKKMRTELEIRNYLKKTKSKLGIESFTFEKKIVYEEPFEIVRYRTKPKGLSGKSKNKAAKERSRESEDGSAKPPEVPANKDPSSPKRSVRNDSESVDAEVGMEPRTTGVAEVVKTAKSPTDKKRESPGVADSGVAKEATTDTEEIIQVVVRDKPMSADLSVEDKGTSPGPVDSAGAANEGRVSPVVGNTATVSDRESLPKVSEKDVADSAEERKKNLASPKSTPKISISVSKEPQGDSSLPQEDELQRTFVTVTNEPMLGQKTAVISIQKDKDTSSFGKYKISTTSLIKRPMKEVHIEFPDSGSTENKSVASRENIKVMRPSKQSMKSLSLLAHLTSKLSPMKTKPVAKRGRKPGKKKRAQSALEDPALGKRKRATKLPSRLRDYAVGGGKDAGESTVTEDDTDSLESTDDADEAVPFYSEVNKEVAIMYPPSPIRADPTTEEIIQSVLGESSQRSGVAKHTGKRKLLPAGSEVVAAKRTRNILSPPPPLTNGALVISKKVCGYNCEGVEGMPPKLQCDVCKCLYHTTCVGYVGKNAQRFTCTTCKMEQLPPGSFPININSPLIINTDSSSNVHITGSTFLQSKTSQSGSKVTLVSSSRTPGPVARMVQAPEQASRQENGHAVTGGPDEVSGQLINLPLNVSQKLDLTKNIDLKYNGLVYVVPPNCLVISGDSVKMLLPPGTLPEAVVKGGPDNPVSISSGKSGSNKISMIQMNSYHEPARKRNSNENAVIAISSEALVPVYVEENSEEAIPSGDQRGMPKRAKRKVGRPRTVRPVRTEKYARPACHFELLHAGFDCMLSIFEYLSLPDRMRAAQVCKTWRRVATQSCLWRKVRLRSFKITNWQAAIECFQDYGSRSLDMRGMQHVNEDANRTWHELHGCMTRLAYLRDIDFPQCPSSVLHTVTEKMTCLRHLVAESIIENVQEPMSSNAKLDLGKFAKLKELEVLKLRGSVGLVQPAFSFSGGLTELSTLTKLHTLSVTTLRDLPGSEFSFLGSLSNLEMLSIGDCTFWTTKTFEDLGKLTKLKFLRLEAGGSLKEAAFGKALARLGRLESLELFKFIVSFDLADSLQTMSWLRKFSIFSERDNQAAAMNSNTLTAVSNMPFLTTVEWGIFDSANTSGNMPSDSIPFKPAGESDSERGPDQADAESNPEYASVNDLVQKLKSHLPDTIIRVFRVPNVSARKH